MNLSKTKNSIKILIISTVLLLAGITIAIFTLRDQEQSQSKKIEIIYEKNSRPQIVETKGEPRLVVQTGHTNDIYTLTLSKDGKFMASGGADDIVKVWNTESGLELNSLESHTSDVGAVAISPDNELVASGDGEEGIIKVWDLKTGKLLLTFDSLDDGIIALTFSPDGKTLVAGSWNANIRLWNVENAKLIRTIPGNDDAGDLSISPSFSPDGKIMAACNDNEKIKMWSFETGELIRTLEGHTDIALSVDFSQDGKRLLSSSEDKTVKLWDLETSQVIKTFEGHSDVVQSVRFSQDGKTFVTSSWDDTVKLWDIETGKELRTFVGHTDNVGVASFIEDENKIVSTGLDRTIKIWDAENGNLLQNHVQHTQYISRVEFLPNEKYFITYSSEVDVRIWDIKTGGVIHSYNDDRIFFAPNRLLNTVASYGKNNSIELINLETGTVIKTIKLKENFKNLTISQDNKKLAGNNLENQTITIWDIKSGKVLNKIRINKDSLVEKKTDYALRFGGIAFSSDGLNIAISQSSKIIILDIKSGEIINTFKTDEELYSEIEFSKNGKFLVLANWFGSSIQLLNLKNGIVKSIDKNNQDEVSNFKSEFPYYFIEGENLTLDGRFKIDKGEYGKPQLVDTQTGKLLASITSIDEKDWAVVTPDGRFDTSKLDNPQGLHWILPDAPFDPLSFEVFMRQYYEPKLLPRLMNCTRENNCDEEFKPVPSLTKLNRTQPKVKITDIKEDKDGTLEVTVEVASIKSETQKDINGKAVESGVFDVRLFRNGQLVGYAPRTEGLNPKPKQTIWVWLSSWFENKEEEENQNPQILVKSKVNLDKNGKAVLKFSNIKKPKTGVKELEFSAYAFNYDQIKSQTDRRTFTITSKQEKGRAYVISLGVNETENQKLNLRYAANDARQTQQSITEKLKDQNQFTDIVNIPLISDFKIETSSGTTITAQDASVQQIREGRKTVTENQATKANLKAIIDVLAGRNSNSGSLNAIPNADELRPANPEDLIIITISAHGFTDKDGVFYIVPSDSGLDPIGSKEFRQKSISSDELSLWLRDVDTGELVLIIDACYSASAVESDDFKPAPMNSRGLGQLSYDKGMRILTATQSDNVALETNKVRQGLLSYALLQDGLNDWKADFKPKNNEIELSEWLGYGVERVPQLYEEIKTDNLSKTTKLVRETADTNESEQTTRIEKQLEKTQQPSLFDFSRRREVTIAKQ